VRSSNRLPALILLLVGIVLLGGCAKDNTDTTSPPVAEAIYVGSDACKTCHQDVWNAVDGSGHPHMLTAIEGNQKPGAPLLLPDMPPGGRAWRDIRYVIGGFGWKARFVGTDGKVIIGADAQYNLPTEQYPTPESIMDPVETPPNYDYACFRCHTTGPGRTSGTFAEAGVRCEACHGPGSLHIASPSGNPLVRDDSAALCGGCHYRNETGDRIMAADGFIEHNAQYEELKESPHKEMKCATCHAVHTGVRRDQVGGIVKQCTSSGCHSGLNVDHFGDVDCVTCHMPYATKSARSRDKYVADVRTHIFKIHEGPESQTQMFESSTEGSFVKEGFGVTLDYVCYQCHRDDQDVGGSNSRKTLQQLAAKAQEIHESDQKLAGAR
jgi:predicted CXXCH cytochrome family protein